MPIKTVPAHRTAPKPWVPLAALGLVLLVAGCGRLLPSQHQTIEIAALPAGQFALDPAHTAILWKVDHFGFATYVGRFNEMSGSLDFDPDNPEAASLTVQVRTASVDTGDPDFDAELAGSGWLRSGEFPTAQFTSQSISITGEATGIASGTLTLAGQTHPADLEITFNGGANNIVTGQYTLGFAASMQIARSQFGITNLVPAIGDAVTLEIHSEFVRQDG